MRRKETEMQVLEYFFLTRFLKIYNIFLYNKVNLNLSLFSFQKEHFIVVARKNLKSQYLPQKKLPSKYPVLLGLSFHASLLTLNRNSVFTDWTN